MTYRDFSAYNVDRQKCWKVYLRDKDGKLRGFRTPMACVYVKGEIYYTSTPPIMVAGVRVYAGFFAFATEAGAKEFANLHPSSVVLPVILGDIHTTATWKGKVIYIGSSVQISDVKKKKRRSPYEEL